MENHGCDTEEDSDIHQRLPYKNPSDPTACISNRKFWKRIKQQPAEVLQRRWGWIGHALRKPKTCITRQALTWNPQGKTKSMTCILRQALTWNPQGQGKRGHPRNTWYCDLEADTKRMGYTWGQLERPAQDRDAWGAPVGGLYSSRGQRQ